MVRSTKQGAKMLTELENDSNNNVIIRKSSNRSFTKTHNKYDAAYKTLNSIEHPEAAEKANPGGFSSTIYFNPEGKPVIEEGCSLKARCEADMANELGHAFDSTRGNSPFYDSYHKGGLFMPKDEAQTTYRENLIRQQLVLPLRRYYTIYTKYGLIQKADR